MEDKMRSWAPHALDVDVESTLAAIEGAATVDLIGTFGDLKCAEPDEAVPDVVRDPSRQDFDYLPVRKNGRITGLFRRAEIARQLEEGNIQCRAHVSDQMEALSEENIVSSGASVLTFIETADYHPCRLVLRKTAIDGIITISDLQRLPVRPVLFLLITHLELLMESKIRKLFSEDPDRSIELLGSKKRKRIEREWTRRRDHNLVIDKLIVTGISDKIEILEKRVGLSLQVDAQGGDFGGIVDLRNGVAHADGYAPTPEKAQELARTVRLIRKLIRHLQ